MNTTTNAVPQRITSEHYQILSSKGNRTYDLKYDAGLRRWTCNCPDVRHNNNTNCKHRRRLIAWIAEQQSSLVQREATQIADVQEQKSEITDQTLYGMMISLTEAEITIKQQGDRIECLEFDLRASDRTNATANMRIAELESRIAELESNRESLHTMQAQIQQLTTIITNAVAKASKPAKEKVDPEREAERLAWTEFEKNPEAGRAKLSKRAAMH